MSKLVLQTAAAVEPISLAEAKTHLRITGTDDDTYLARLIDVAIATLQQRYWTQICTATFDQYFDNWPSDHFLLRKHPVLAVSTVKYTDQDGSEQTVSTDTWEQADEDGRGIVRLKYNQVWPSDCRGHEDDIVIRYTAGYGDESVTPEPIKQALLLIVTDLYTFRESVAPLRLDRVPQAVDALMSGYSFYSLG